MLWACCKDYADSTSNEIYLSVPDLKWCFGLGGFFFWQITCVVDVSRVSDERNVKTTIVKIF